MEQGELDLFGSKVTNTEALVLGVAEFGQPRDGGSSRWS
jgi:hypothetical protein